MTLFYKLKSFLIKMMVFLLFPILCSGGDLYHGSSQYFFELQPHYSQRLNKQNSIVWEGCALFVSQDRRVALFYTHNRVPDYKAGVDLIKDTLASEPLNFVLIGGTNKEDALLKLYGPLEDCPEAYGYIYTLEDFGNKNLSVKEAGLGAMERVVYNSNFPKKREKVHRRREIEHYVKKGLIQLVWLPD